MSKIAYIAASSMSLRYLLLNQLIYLQQAGYDVTTISSPGTHVAALEEAHIRHISLPISRNISPLADLRSLWQLYRVMKRERFTIVHTHTPKPGLLGQVAARLAGVPIIVNTIHGYYFHEHTPYLTRRFYIALEKASAHFSTLIFFVNEEDTQTALREGIASDEKVRLLGNGGIGIDVHRFHPKTVSEGKVRETRSALHLSENHLIVGFVGRLVREKGIPELLEAAALVRKDESRVRFLIVGPTDTEKSDAVDASLAEEHGVADICRFVGLREDIPELMALMDVFVLPSHREGFPVSPMEASAMGVPCIVTDVRGCRQAVTHNANGLVVPLGDVRALADAIIELLTNRAKAKRMGATGRQMAEQKFDEQLVFARVKAEYTRLLQEKGLPVPDGPVQPFLIATH